jgi:hypothetical protein
MKYFSELSKDISVLSEVIIGKNLNMFSSRATHMHMVEHLLRDRKILKNKDS